MLSPLPLALALGLATPAFAGPQPPVAPTGQHSSTHHGITWDDPYYWLYTPMVNGQLGKPKPEVLAYLTAEENYGEAITAPLKPLEEKLFQEMRERSPVGALTTSPVRIGDYLYFVRAVEGKPFRAYYRSNLDGSGERKVLDLNEDAAGAPFYFLYAFLPSPDGRKLLYSTQPGKRVYSLFLKDLETELVTTIRSKDLGPPVTLDAGSHAAWSADGKAVYYTVEDAAKRPYRVYRQPLGSGEAPTLLYEEKDPLFSVALSKSRDGRFLFRTAFSKDTSEVAYASASGSGAKWRIISPRSPGRNYRAEARGAFFYLWSNHRGANYGLYRAPVLDPGAGNWAELVAPREDTSIERFLLFRDFAIRIERKQGMQAVLATSFLTGKTRRVSFPEPVYLLSADPIYTSDLMLVAPNHDYDASHFRFRYTSMTTLGRDVAYDVAKDKSRVLGETQLGGGYDPARYRVERLFISGVPVSLITLKQTPRDGTSPLLLLGYGAYGTNYRMNDVQTYSPEAAASLLDRGVTVAIAHVRGGGELGPQWYAAGKLLNKKNTMADFIAVTEGLVSLKYADPRKIAIQSHSAGGILVGAVLNQRPELYRAAVAKQPFVDVLNTQLDTSLPFTTQEFAEWGNPIEDPQAFKYIREYSPYDNVGAKDYPALLVRTALGDSAVLCHEPAKWVARLRAMKTDKNPLILRVDLTGDHGGGAGLEAQLRSVAEDYAFILNRLE
jgi:oligopeptidase B